MKVSRVWELLRIFWIQQMGKWHSAWSSDLQVGWRLSSAQYSEEEKSSVFYIVVNRREFSFCDTDIKVGNAFVLWMKDDNFFSGKKFNLKYIQRLPFKFFRWKYFCVLQYWNYLMLINNTSFPQIFSSVKKKTLIVWLFKPVSGLVCWAENLST